MSTLVEHVVDGGRIEDDRVEAKSIWPADHRKAARQIAGLANASGGETALWIVGLNEDARKVVSPGPDDPGAWWASTRKWFADVAPEVALLTVPTRTGSVIAIQFDTSRAPYMVTTHGKDGVDREVPWRQGNQTRSAHRSELIRSLVAQAQAPLLDGVTGYLRVMLDAYETDTLVFDFELTAFMECLEPCRLPEHQWRATLTAGNHVVKLGGIDISGPLNVVGSSQFGMPIREGVGSITYVTKSALHVNGSDSIKISDYHRIPLGADIAQAFYRARKVHFDLRMPVATSSRVAVLVVDLVRQKLAPLSDNPYTGQLDLVDLRLGEFTFGDGVGLDSWSGDKLLSTVAADFRRLRRQIIQDPDGFNAS